MANEVKPAELIFISFMLLHGFVAAFNCSSPTPSVLFSELDKNLFSKKLVPPIKNFRKTLNVTISITVVGILGVNEKSQTLTTVLWEVLEWEIDGLSWDEEQCGAKRVSILRDNLWIPDVHITEFVDDSNFPKTPYVYLYNTGHVHDDKPMRVVSSCQLGIYTFPFDVQNCTLTFGSYLHFASDIRMVLGASAEDILRESREVMETNGEWELADIGIGRSTLTLDAGHYSEIKYFIVLRRRPILYVVNLLIPSCFLLTVDLFSFMLPPASVDRSSFKMTLILGYTVFLLIMNDLLPVTGEETPLLNVFFSISLALMVASLLETVFITNIQFSSSQYSAVPHWLSVIVLRYLAVVVCLPPKKKSETVTVHISPSVKEPVVTTTVTENISNDTPAGKPPSSPLVLQPPSSPLDPALDELRRLSRDLTSIRLQVDKYFQGSKTSHEWQMVGEVVDRLLFYLYLVFIVVSFLTIMGIWAWNSSYAI